MADDKHARSASSLKNLLETVYEVHRKDIKTYTSGHLNLSKLLKPPDDRHKRWESSDKPPIRLKPPSHQVDLPVRKGELSSRDLRHKTMADRLVEFSLGPVRQVAQTSKLNPEESEKDQHTIKEETTGGSKLTKDRVYVEELRLPEIMIPLTRPKGISCAEKSKTKDLHTQHAFIETYLSYPTKTEQFASFKKFGDQVMNLGDAHDRGVLTGEKNVRSLEQRLAKQLSALEAGSQRGPNFLRLQLYNQVLDEIIADSQTFGPLLTRIKDEYDSYMSHLLDTQKPSQHKVLYHHIDSLSENPSASDKLKDEEKRVQALEKEARVLLDENARLTQVLHEEEVRTSEELQAKVVVEPQAKASVHIEEVPKDLEEQVEELHAQILAQLDHIDDIKRHQKEYCVPVTVCQHLEHCIKETEVDIQKLLKQNEFLEQTIEELEQELQSMLDRRRLEQIDARYGSESTYSYITFFYTQTTSSSHSCACLPPNDKPKMAFCGVLLDKECT
ncbi:uncharacterized protein C6orf118-like isoform X1 [Montipora foliosa]|uniref:uncharacterized protein C6orf118-like isoform X1 n=1 Tax=Montipora foliosa TaxID=591990 RepID=UPI0035F20954